RGHETVHEDGVGVLVHFVLDRVGVGGDLDHDVEVVRNILAGGNLGKIHGVSVRWLCGMAADYSNREPAVATRPPDTSVAAGNSAKWNKHKSIYSFLLRRRASYPAGSLGPCARPVSATLRREPDS